MKLAWRAGYIDNSPSTKLLSFDDIHDFLSMSEDERFELFLLLRQETEAPGEQIAAFLQIPLRKV